MMTTKLRAFHGDPAIKAKYLDRVRKHREMDEIVQRTDWEGGKGGCVGCIIHGSDPLRFEQEIGFHESIASLAEAIHDGLPIEDAKLWPEQFLDAVPVNANLDLVIPKFMVWLLTSDEIGLPHIADKQGKVAIARVAALWERTAQSAVVAEAEWDAARDAARDAMWTAAWDAEIDAARSATWDRARTAARDAAWDAAKSVGRAKARAAARIAAKTAGELEWEAAWEAAWSPARDAARDTAWKSMAAQLLKILAACPTI